MIHCSGRLSLCAALATFFVPFAAAQPIPTTEIVTPDKAALIGGTFQFCVTFENSGTAPGFAPFIDLLMPIGGADNTSFGGPCDGISFVDAKVISTNPNVPLPQSIPAIPTTCSSVPVPADDPYKEITAPLTLPVGTQLVRLALPFGSFQPDQPKVMIEVRGKVHDHADDGTPLHIRTRGGFRYGANPGPGPGLLETTGNPPTGWKSFGVTPRVLILTKKFSGTDDELVAGPNFVHSFDIIADVAVSQKIGKLVIQDCAPTGTTWVGGPAITGGGTWSTTSPLCFDVAWPPIIGAGANTVKVTRKFFMGNTTTSCGVKITNTAKVRAGLWDTVDQRDPDVNWAVTPGPSASASFWRKGIAAQKKPVVPAGGPKPGQIVTHDIAFQVSDYHRYGEIVITDTMTDGQKLKDAILSITDKLGSVASFTIPEARITRTRTEGNFQCPPGADPCRPQSAPGGGLFPNSTIYRFDISGALKDKGHSGVLTGGHVGAAVAVKATGLLRVRTEVLDAFAYGTPKGGINQYVDKLDPLLDYVRLTARPYKANLSVPPQPTTLALCVDNNIVCLAVPGDVLKKEIVAVNGVWSPQAPLGGPLVTVGDKVTFRLSKTIPTGDAEKLDIQDWYPLPVLQAPSFGVIAPCPAGTPPPVPAGPCYRSGSAPIPSVLNSDNSVTFDFGTFHSTANLPRPIDVYTTLTVSNEPFADGLLLTNEAQECESNSYGTRFCQAAIAQFRLQEPNVGIRKGACALPCKPDPPPSTEPACPTCTTPVVPKTIPIVDADALDRVRFVLTIENSGSGPKGAFDVTVKDTLLDQYPGAIDYSTFCVRRGNTATAIPFTFVTKQPKSFEIRLTDPSPNQGALAASPSSTGGNVAVVMYDVILGSASDVKYGCYWNQGELVRYANTPGGPDFVSRGYMASKKTSSVGVCINPSVVSKQIVAKSEPVPALPYVVIGDVLRYELRVLVPEGTAPNITVTENLPPGIEFFQDIGSPMVEGIGMAPYTAGTVTNKGTAAKPVFVIVNKDVETAKPSWINAEKDPGCELLVLTFLARVANDAVNLNGEKKENTFTVANQKSLPVTVTIAEPKLSVTKKATVLNNVVTYEVMVTNTSPFPAWDIEVIESQPACLKPLGSKVTLPTGQTATGTHLHRKFSPLMPGAKATLLYTAAMTCNECEKLKNTVEVRWTSLPGWQTYPNAVGAHVGTPGTRDGERTGTGIGTGTPPGHNIYSAKATAELCGKCKATICGRKIDEAGNGLPDWLIFAVGKPSGNVQVQTGPDGKYCLELEGPGTYQLQEMPKEGWQQILPADANGYTVKVECGPHLGLGHTVPSGPLDFQNRNACAHCLPGDDCGAHTAYNCMPHQIPCGSGPPCIPPMECIDNECKEPPG